MDREEDEVSEEEGEGKLFVSGDDHNYVNEEPPEDFYTQCIGNLQRD